MTILIKNILLIDGANRPAVKADVLVKNERIAAMGYFPGYKATEIIDGMGAYLAPGFIDINASSDLYLTLFSNPSQKDFLFQGITTIIGGQGGISLAPLLYGSLDLNKFYANPYKINVDWHTMEEFLKTINRRTLGVNFGTLTGHSTIRQALIGDDFRDLTQKELEVFEYILEKALSDGAFGISFDLNSPLTSFTPYKEIKSLLETVRKFKGLFSVKLRNVSDSTVYPKDAKDHFYDSVSEIVNLTKETGVRTQINNFSCLKGFEKDYQRSLELISENSAAADVFFDIHPFDSSIVPLISFLPLWARRGNFSEIIKNLESNDILKKIKKDLLTLKAEEIKIFQAPSNEYLIGKTLKEFSENRDLNYKDGLLELMKLTKLRAELIYKNLSLRRLSEALVNDRSIISSSAPSFNETYPGRKIAESFQISSKILELIFKEKVMPIELAVKKMTSLPARQLGLKNRGMIRENYFADLVLFRESKIETVIVNGKIAVKNGEFQNAFGGKILRREI